MNPPYDVFLLDRIDRADFARPRKTPERDRLQRLGLIKSDYPPAAFFDDRRVYWTTTEKGKQEAKTNRDEGLLDPD